MESKEEETEWSRQGIRTVFHKGAKLVSKALDAEIYMDIQVVTDWKRNSGILHMKLIPYHEPSEIIYLDVLILRWLEASSCWTAFANFLSFDATTIAVI